MKYTVEFVDRVPNSVFIYSIKQNRLFGCDLVISTNYDAQVYDGMEDRINSKDIKFKAKTNFFNSEPCDSMEDKLILVEQKQRQRGWACLRLEVNDTFDEAIKYHLWEYKISFFVRAAMIEKGNEVIRRINNRSTTQ